MRAVVMVPRRFARSFILNASLASAGCASNCAVVVPRRYASILSVYARSSFSSRLRGRLNVCISVVPFIREFIYLISLSLPLDAQFSQLEPCIGYGLTVIPSSVAHILAQAVMARS